MKLRLSVSRKAGAPGYGSDGASAEVEIEIEAITEALATYAGTWYLALEQAVGAELDRMQSAHSQPQPQPAAPAAPRLAERPPSDPPIRGMIGYDGTPPPRRRVEPGWDDQPQEPQLRTQNGYGGRQQQRTGQRTYGPPKTGSELMAAAAKLEPPQIEFLKCEAKRIDRGPIRDWPTDLVDWGWDICQRQIKQGGQWGGN